MRTSMTKLSLTFAVMAMMTIGSFCVAQETTESDSLTDAQRAAAAVKMKKEKREALKAKRIVEKRLNRVWKTAVPVKGFESAELFKAIEDGQIEVLIKTIDEKKSNVIVTNKSDKPLAITMPATFAAIPTALAQQILSLIHI